MDPGSNTNQEHPPGLWWQQTPSSLRSHTKTQPSVATQARNPPWYQLISLSTSIRQFLTTLKSLFLPLFVVHTSFCVSFSFIALLLLVYLSGAKGLWVSKIISKDVIPYRWMRWSTSYSPSIFYNCVFILFSTFFIKQSSQSTYFTSLFNGFCKMFEWNYGLKLLCPVLPKTIHLF